MSPARTLPGPPVTGARRAGLGPGRAAAPVRLRRGSPAHRGLQALGLAALVGLAMWASGLSSFRVGQLTQALIYASAIAGLNLATGYTGQLSIGHSAFFGLGAYTTGMLISERSWNPLVTLPASAALCFLAGLVVGLPALRIRGINLALVTLALGVAFPQLIDRFPSITGGTHGLNMDIRQLLPPHWTGISVANRAQYYYWLALGVLVLVLLMSAAVTGGRVGLTMKAIRDNELAASAFGVNLAVVKTAVFGLSAAACGLAGSVFAIYLGTLSADSSFTLLLSITLITGLVVGGVSTTAGPVIGGLAVVYIPFWTENLRQGEASGLFFGVILVALMFVMPEGAMGLLRRVFRRFVSIQSTRPGSVPPGTAAAPAVPATPTNQPTS